MADAQRTTAQAMEFLGISQRRTLYKWAKRLGCDTSRGFYWQSEIEAIRDLMQGDQPASTPEEEGFAAQQEASDLGGEAVQGFIDPYRPMISAIAAPVAKAIHQEIHMEIARQLFNFAKDASYVPPLVRATPRALAGVSGSGLLLAEAVAR